MEIVTGFLIVCMAGGIAFAARANWGAHIGQSLGKEYMKELGVDGGPKEYDEKSRGGRKA